MRASTRSSRKARTPRLRRSASRRGAAAHSARSMRAWSPENRVRARHAGALAATRVAELARMLVGRHGLGRIGGVHVAEAFAADPHAAVARALEELDRASLVLRHAGETVAAV